MPSQLELRSGAVGAELDADASVIVLSCELHRVQDAIQLSRDNLDALVRDFFDRHRACANRTMSFAQAVLQTVSADRVG